MGSGLMGRSGQKVGAALGVAQVSGSLNVVKNHSTTYISMDTIHWKDPWIHYCCQSGGGKTGGHLGSAAASGLMGRKVLS